MGLGKRKKGMKERLERRKEGRGERDVGKDEGGRVGEQGGREDGEDGREGEREGGRQGWRMLCPGLTSVGRWEFLASSSSLPVPSSWKGKCRRAGEVAAGTRAAAAAAASGRGAVPPAPPASPGLRLTRGWKRSRSPPPPPLRVQPKRERQQLGSPLGEAVCAQARPLVHSRASAAPAAPWD